MFAGDFWFGGVSVPSTLSLFMRCAGSCEKMHVSPARQLPDIQYLVSGSASARLGEQKRPNLLANVAAQVVAKSTICSHTAAGCEVELADYSGPLIGWRGRTRIRCHGLAD